MATADKLNRLIETKTEIKNAITQKGVSVSNEDTFFSYADKIRQIEGGEKEDLTEYITENKITSFSYISQKLFKKLPEVFFECIDTSNATSLQDMFRSSENLIEVNLSSLNMSNIKNVTNMFYNCVNLINVERYIGF